ncbi:hypothetical protein Tco_0884332 [Tanacetum coccineum]
MIDSQMDDMIKEKLALKQQTDSFEYNLSNQIKEKESLLQIFTVFKNESKEKESKYMDKEIYLEKKIKELDNIVYKVGQPAQTVHIKAQRIKPTLYDGSVISSQHVANHVIDNEETLILEEAPKELPKTLKDIFNVFDKDLLNEVTEVQTVFNQMEAAVQHESCVKCVDLDVELLKSQNAYNDFSKSYSQLEKHCISLELIMKLNQEIFQKDSFSNNQNALEILEYFENNDLKAQLQAKDTTILKSCTSASRSQPTSNKKNDRISQSPSSNMENKVEVVQIVLWVYYVEGLGHNLFSLGKFCDADLEVAFRKNTCFIRNLEGVDLLLGSRDTNLYTISLDDMLKTSPISKDGLARGLPKLKFKKDHLCSACALCKSKKSSHQPKTEDTNQEKLYLLHMDLCGPMHVECINGKKYILVIVDDYS